jgi:hypothetical protein
MNIKLQEKLDALTNKYRRINGLSKRLPLFEDRIINDEIDPSIRVNRGTKRITDRYKKMPFHWGINVGMYDNDNTPTNYTKKISGNIELVSVYINTLSLFSDNDAIQNYAREELKNVISICNLFYFDYLNTTLYMEFEEVESTLDRIVSWYEIVREKSNDQLKQDKIKKLQLELEKLQ